MKNRDKIIAAFLVSVGFFSAVQAAQYVGTLSAKDKAALGSVAKASSGSVSVCEGFVFTSQDPKRAG